MLLQWLIFIVYLIGFRIIVETKYVYVEQWAAHRQPGLQSSIGLEPQGEPMGGDFYLHGSTGVWPRLLGPWVLRPEPGISASQPTNGNKEQNAHLSGSSKPFRSSRKSGALLFIS